MRTQSRLSTRVVSLELVAVAALLVSCSGSSSKGPAASTCTGITCGGNGQCVLTADGTALCLCDPGFTASGLICVAPGSQDAAVAGDTPQTPQPDSGCVPQCTGKTCGSNGCGGLCGTCPTGEGCSPLGTCVTPACGSLKCGETDSNGIACSACDTGSCCNGTCIVLGMDEANCGKCALTCPALQSCVVGECLACTANCTGKTCGPDGCGGLCGTCSAGTVCFGGTCTACLPNCLNSVCGDDGCGGTCGKCTANQACVAGQCSSCTAACVGKNCGENDGCGGKCDGTCPNGGTCQGGACAGGCVPDCSGKECGYDGCGSTCGQCPFPQTCTAGKCVCKPWCTTKGLNCGPDGCGGTCGTCTGTQICGGLGTCVDDPAIIGCSDSTREGFKDLKIYPTVASCQAAFAAQSLRVTRTGESCGNSLRTCVVPEDACAAGWHLCMKGGWPGDLASRVSGADCGSPVAGTGRFVAGSEIGDDTTGPLGCPPTPPIGCRQGESYWGMEAICCGTACQAPSSGCDSAVWSATTRSTTPGWDCGNISAGPGGVDGVLCCKDPPVTGS